MTRTKTIGSLVALACATTFSTASAAPYILTAEQDLAPQAPASTFALDFGAQGGVRDSEISNTNFGMEVDFDAGTARFSSYTQNIGSINLPDGSANGVETGPITVTIAPGSPSGILRETGAGTFEFETTDTYIITFTNDLSAFGFPVDQPVALESTSIGTLIVDELRDGAIEGHAAMQWNGGGFMLDPANVGEFLSFDYRCDINSVFSAVEVPEPASAAILALGAIMVLRRRS